jgi:hypothetical protein
MSSLTFKSQWLLYTAHPLTQPNCALCVSYDSQNEE